MNPHQLDDGAPVNPPPARNASFFLHDTCDSEENANPADPTLNRPRFDPENTLTGAPAMVL